MDVASSAGADAAAAASGRPGLYLHLPFCSAICPYCDFAVTKGGAEERARFVAALRRELELWGARGFGAGKR